MTIAHAPIQAIPIEYPESDGQPMAENTKQVEWIVTIEGGLAAQYASDPNVFVAGDLFWYPVEGRNDIRVALDVLVVLGRPRGHRGRYLQWLEDNIPPQVVFEIWSPGNTTKDYTNKYRFYNKYGVQECYLYDPDRSELLGWLRRGDDLIEIESMNGWVSPRLGIRFEWDGGELKLFHPDGERFRTYVELAQAAEAERVRAETERARAERLAAQLRALGIEPES
jgi:Uma2 family endonuclease